MERNTNSNSKVMNKKNKVNYPSFKKNNQTVKVFSCLKKKINEFSLNQNKNITNYYLTRNLTKNYGINHPKKDKKANNSFIIDINSIEKEIIKENYEKQNKEKSIKENKKMIRSNSSKNYLINNKFTLLNNNNKQKNPLIKSSSYAEIYLNKNKCLKSNEIKKYNGLKKNLTAEKEKTKKEKNEKNTFKKNLFINNLDYKENKPLNLNNISKMNKKNNEIRMLYNICLIRKKMIPKEQDFYYNENMDNSYTTLNEKEIHSPIYNNNEFKNSFQNYKTQIRNFDKLNNLIPEEKEELTDSAKELIEKKNKIINDILTKSGVNVNI